MTPAIRFVLWTLSISAAAPACWPAQQAAPDRKVAAEVKHIDDPFLNGSPFTFDQVLKLSGQNAIPLRRRKDAIQNRGVDFALTAEMLDKLRAAGAPADMLDLIRSKAKPAPVVAVAKPQPRQGRLALSCSPGDCEIALNNGPRRATKDGALEVAQLAAGQWTIDFQKEGYAAHHGTVTVEADKTTSYAVSLEPDRASQEVFGTALFQRVKQAVGAEDGGQSIASVQAVGSATIWHADGTSVRWTLLMRNRLDRALFQAQGGSGVLHEVAFVGNEYKASKGLKGQDALDLPTGFGFIRDYQLAVLIAKLSDPQYKILASHPEPREGDEFDLTAENGAEKISINLDSGLRPQRVRIVTSTGIGSANIVFSDYLKTEKASYPRTMQVKPGGRDQGVEVRLNSVVLGPNLGDNDYKLKGKPFVKLQE